MISTYNNPYYFASSPTSASLDRTSGSASASHSASHSSSSGKRPSSERGASISSLGSSSGEEDVTEEEGSPDIEDILSPPRSMSGARQAGMGPGSRLTKPSSPAGGLARALARTDRPPRIDDLFAELPSAGTSSMGAHNNKRRRVCAEPNCCQKGLRGEASSKVAAAGAAALAVREQEVSKTFQDLFWKRQMWLMEHRDADGESHCSDESSDEADSAQNEAQDADKQGKMGTEGHSKRRQGKKRSRSRHDDVLRTAGAGLPLARVKRAMKSADEEIKMISHESPSLLSRLCTVLISDISVRAGRSALTNGRRTITCNDLREVTVGKGEGAGDEWEFLRDCVEGEGRVE